MDGTTLGKSSSTRQDDSERSMLAFELPQLPQESNILSHQATQWIEASEAILRVRGMLEVAQGGLPHAAKKIIDTPVSTVPPVGGQLSYRDDQQRLNIITQNERNRVAREDLMLTSWTSLHGALLFSAKTTCPLLYEEQPCRARACGHAPAGGWHGLWQLRHSRRGGWR